MTNDFFADKKYQQMDWISQAVSPWEFDLLPIIAAMPDKIEITPELLLKRACFVSGDMDIIPSLTQSAAKLGHDLSQYPTHLYPWNNLFQIHGETDAIVDFESMTLSTSIAIIKVKPTLDDSDCCECASRIIRDKISWNFEIKQPDLVRAGEIMDLLGINPGAARGGRNRRQEIRGALIDIMEQDKWRIRNMKLVHKIPEWVIDYINNGKLDSMANFAKLKVMTHSGQPIYSMSEVE